MLNSEFHAVDPGVHGSETLIPKFPNVSDIQDSYSWIADSKAEDSRSTRKNHLRIPKSGLP